MPSVRLGLTAIVALTLLVTLPASADPLGSAITYQGHLKNAGSPANGPHTMEFRLFPVPTGGSQVGPTLTHDDNSLPQITVTNGLFTVELDFGASSYNGDKRWLDITVGGTPLVPRQELTPAPHARFSAAPWVTSGATISYNAGNVGIGTTSPESKLDVRDGPIQWKQTNFLDAWRIGYDPTEFYFYIEQIFGTASRPLVVSVNEDVGIGTTSPSAKLHLSGAMKIDGANTLEYGAGVSGKEVNAGKIGYQTFTSDALDIVGAGTDATNRKIKFHAEGGADFTGNGTFSGSLGIGTTSPASKLQVAGGVLARGGSPGPGGSNNNGYAFSGNGGDSDSGLFSSADGLLQFHTDNTERMRIASDGRVSIGTTALFDDLTVGGDSADFEDQANFISVNARFTPGIRFRILGTSLWSIHPDEGETYGPGLTFNVGGGSNGGFNTKMIIESATGNVGVGTINPGQKLHVVGNICATGTIGACSDERFKKNVTGLSDALDKLARLRGVSFDWRRDDFCDHEFADGPQVGFIAQEVEKVLPQIVQTGSDGYRSVDYGRLTPVIVEAIKQMRTEKDEQLAQRDKEIAALKERITAMELLVQQVADANNGGTR